MAGASDPEPGDQASGWLMADFFPPEAIAFLRNCRHDPAATVYVEVRSGSLNWEDEHILAFASLCKSLSCEHHAALFAFRTSLIEGTPREEMRYAWDEVRNRCPEWIGLRPERTAPSRELQAYLRRSVDEF